MSPLDHCVATLRALTLAADSNGVVLAEKAIDAYAMNVNGHEQKVEALRALRRVIVPTEGSNLPAWAFAEVLVEYVDQQIRALEPE